MDLKKLVEAIDKQIVKGDIIGAFKQYAADNCITFSNSEDKTFSKAQKMDALHGFFSNVASVNKITNQGAVIATENETKSQFSFDFTNHQGQPLVYNEVIRRVWSNGQLVEEQYLFGETLPTEKKAKADANIAPTAAKAPAKKVAEKKPAAAPKKETKAAVKKANDLTLIEGIGPKIAELLVKAGIVTFANLAEAKPEAIKTILEAAGKRYQMHNPATWPTQATLARDGKTAELEKLQSELKGGK